MYLVDIKIVAKENKIALDGFAGNRADTTELERKIGKVIYEGFETFQKSKRIVKSNKLEFEQDGR